MNTVKTAISIQKPLFERAEKLARQMKVSRSRLFVIALEEYMKRRQNRELLQQINAAYEDEPDPQEKALRQGVEQEHKRLVEGEW